MKSGLRLRGIVTAAVAALAATLLPMAPAQATYGPQDSAVHLQLFGSSSTQVGSIDGTVEFDSGNTMFRYTLTICRQSSYTAPWANIYVNGVLYTQIPGSWTFGTTLCPGGGPVGVSSAEVPYGGVVSNVLINFHGSSFSFPGGFKEVQKSITKDNPYN